MNTAAIYIRVSTEDQTDYSPDAQKRLLLSYAKQNDFLVPDDYIYIDEGISGRRADKRPAFMQMIRMAKKKPRPFDVILVHKFDRFSRSREDSILYKSLLKRECGIRVISTTEHLEDDKFSIILEAILEAMAEYYSLNLSDEVLKGMTEKAIRGGYQAAPPLGYEIRYAREIPKIKEDEAQIVRSIFDRFINFHQSPYEIAKELNRKGFLTKRSNPFEKRTIEYILKNPFYAGYIRFQLKRDAATSILTKGLHEPLITEEEYQTVKTYYTSRVRKPREHSIGCKHWLSGMVKCSNCGNSLLVFKRKLENQNKTYYNLQCCGYQKGSCLQSHQLSEKKLLSTLTSSLMEVYPQNSNIYQLSVHTMNTPTEDMQANKEAIHKLSIRLQRAKDAYLNGVDTLEEYTVTKIAVTKEITLIEQNIQKALNSTNTELSNPIYLSLAEILQSEIVSQSDKQIILSSLIHHIVYDKTNATLRFYYNAPSLSE
ncbi:MAG: recombinase family protein [Clostridiales bacterium]|nr:recombinase family protein [Clostridiales bacterium]